MRLLVNGEAWVLHFRHWSHMHGTRMTQAWLHREPCTLVGGETGECVIQTTDAAIFIFPLYAAMAPHLQAAIDAARAALLALVDERVR